MNLRSLPQRSLDRTTTGRASARAFGTLVLAATLALSSGGVVLAQPTTTLPTTTPPSATAGAATTATAATQAALPACPEDTHQGVTTTPTLSSASTTTATATPLACSEGTHQQSVTTTVSPGADGTSASATATRGQVAPQATSTVPSTEAPETSAPATTTPAAEQVKPGKKIPFTGLPTENPNSTVVPGKMRSDREELPEGYTKDDADKAEIAEAKILAAEKSRSSNARSSVTATNAVAASLPTDCMTYWPAWQYQVCGLIRVKYDSLGGSTSILLLPTSNELVNPDTVGRRQLFANGPIYWHPTAGAHPVLNHFLMKWGQHNWESGWMGYPTTDEIILQNGRRQEFQSGAAIYWSPLSLGIVGGAIRTKYNALGAETGPLGYPSSDEVWATKYNGRYNNFLNGTITWSGPTGARVLYGAVRDRWAEVGREDGAYGYPLSDEQVLPDGVGHFVQFESGDYVYWAPVIGAWRVPWKIHGAWEYLGTELGVMGYPTALPENAPAPGISWSQKFQNGEISLGTDGSGYYYHY